MNLINSLKKVRGRPVFLKRLIGSYRGMTILPYIFFSKRAVDPNNIPPKLLRHENIHIQQELWWGLILFLVIYYITYVINFVIAYKRYTLKLKPSPGKTWWKVFKQRNGIASHAAYRMSFFEREAYANEWNETYLETRKLYNELKYLKKRESNKY